MLAHWGSDGNARGGPGGTSTSGSGGISTSSTTSGTSSSGGSNSGGTGTADVIDASVVLTDRKARDTIITSAPDDLRKLDATAAIERIEHHPQWKSREAVRSSLLGRSIRSNSSTIRCTTVGSAGSPRAADRSTRPLAKRILACRAARR